MLRTNEYRRLSLWRNVISAALHMMPASEDEWAVLSVHSDGTMVARRRFASLEEADAARRRFVESVECMSSSDHEHADWQAVLDAS